MADSGAEHDVSELGKCEEGALVSSAIGGADTSHGVEETLPDYLKNTPSNIARLEDEIEHCKGRQKYLAQTRSPSDGGDVRWYFCKVPLAENELAASVPRSEIVGKSDYFRFGVRDSLAIEASFLQREEELLSAWWKDYAECSEGPREPASSSKNLDTKSNFPSEDAESAKAKLYDFEEERVGVPVKGGLYEVDLVQRHCFPVYWNGENRRVLRGHWFARKGLDWLPIREDVSEQLEIAYSSQVWHRRTFQPSGLFAARVDLQFSTMGLHALFTGEDDTWEAWLNVDGYCFTGVSKFSGNGIKLRRGYSPCHSPKPTQDELRQQKEEEMDDYCSQVPVRHLVFMVHGIGQRLENSNLVDDVGNFRHITASLAEKHLTSYQRGAQRVLYIPCQWRRGLKLSGETAVEKITLDGVRGLRVMLSATVHDVLYYMSPIYCQDIIDSVSIYGHSLGSVISYDILCHQEVLSSPFPLDWMYKQHARNEDLSADSHNDKNSSMIAETKNNVDPKDEDKKHATNEDLPADLHNDKNSAMIAETENTVDPIGEDKMSAQPILVEFEDEYTHGSSATASSIKLDPEELSARVVEPNALDANNELVCDSGDILSPKIRLDDMIETNCAAPVDAYEAEEVCEDTDNKEKTIQSLREEIDSLKTKMAEMELQSSVGHSSGGWRPGHEKMLVNMPKQADLEILPPNQNGGGPKSYTHYINYTMLEFKVDTFFAVGSPLGVFLALRNIRLGMGKGQEYWEEDNIIEEMPSCRQMFNIFHPYDPVAYRIEPLVCKEYLSKRPVIVPYHKGGKRLHIGFQEFTERLAARSQSVKDHLSSVRVKVLTVCQSRRMDSLEEDEENDQQKEEFSYGSLMMERVTGGAGRIDHMLQDKTFEHPYLQAIGAHTNYWRDYDTALFMLKHLYRDIPEEDPPNSSREPGGSTSIAEEEAPLTFSDQTMVRSFSSRARKFMKKS